jgi:hypothetical protein
MRSGGVGGFYGEIGGVVDVWVELGDEVRV